MLRLVTLPNATKYFVAHGKFDTQHPIKTCNIEADYPAALPYLRTLARWAAHSNPSDERFRDGYDLFCLRNILAKNEGFDYAILLRGVDGFQEHWLDLRTAIQEQTFLTFAAAVVETSDTMTERNVIFDLGDRRAVGLLEQVCELYLTGAAYALSPYCLSDALATALHSLILEDEIR